MEWMLYGATGITGQLIMKTAVQRGHRPILAGRNAEALRRLAEPKGLTWRTADLGDEGGLRELVAAAPLTLLAASTFNTASLRLARACLVAGTHYLDLANEVPVLEAVYGLDDEARARGVTLLPGVGFGTVAADTLARYLVGRLPDAEVLDLTIDLYTAGTSPGALANTLRVLGLGAQIRRAGRLERVWFGSRTPGAVVPPGARTVIAVPSGELSAVYRTTGVPNISVSRPVPVPQAVARAVLPLLALVARSKQVQSWAAKRRSSNFPTADPARRSRVFGRAANARGETVSAQLETDEGYAFSAESAVAAVEAVLADPVPGAHTPGSLLGPDFALRVPGTRRLDIRAGLER